MKFRYGTGRAPACLDRADNNTLWAGFRECRTTNGGSPVCTRASSPTGGCGLRLLRGGTGFHECVAVSTTADPAGTCYRYPVRLRSFPDAKFGVWPDGYYVTYNAFQRGWHCLPRAKTCAMNRGRTHGAASPQQCFDRAENGRKASV